MVQQIAIYPIGRESERTPPRRFPHLKGWARQAIRQLLITHQVVDYRKFKVIHGLE